MHRKIIHTIGYPLVVLLTLCSSVFVVIPAWAADLPPRAREELAKILEGEKFQPRREVSSLWNDLMASINRWLVEQLGRLEDLLRSVVSQKDDGSSSFLQLVAEYILAFCNFVAEWFALIVGALVGATILLLLGYFVSRVIRDYCSSRPKSEVPAGQPSKRKILDPHYIQTLLSSGSLLEALDYMRSVLRLKFRSRYALEHSKTDREVLRLLPQEEEDRVLFSELSRYFEIATFARGNVDREGIRVLIERALGSLEARL